MKVLITGAAGMLGQDVAVEFRRRGFHVIAMDRAMLDITCLEHVKRAIGGHSPGIVINCAAYTDVDGAESEPQMSFFINGLGPRNLALACRETGSVLVHISTDYVFSGDRERPYGVYDPTRPVNVYGASKLWGERAVLQLLKTCYLVRTSWLFGPGGKNFVSTMIKLGRAGKPVKVVDDQFGCPTFTEDLAMALADLVETGCYGIYHITNQNPTNWFGFAGAIFKNCNLSLNIIPCKTREMDRPAKRPAFSVLDSFPLKETIGYLLPGWDDALRRYLVKKGELKR